jgi:hypothetical protein
MSDGTGVGSWDPPIENALQIVGVHAVVLWTGKVLYWSFDARAVGQLHIDQNFFYTYFTNPNLGSYQIWDPATKTAGPVKPIGRNAFCAAQCALPDGTIFAAGGQDQYGAIELSDWIRQASGWFGDAVLGGSDEGALKDIHTYDPVADKWTLWATMPDGRYYPTCLELSDGNAFVAGGLSNLQRWVFSGGTWCENDQFEIYPRGLLSFGSVPKKFMSADQYPIIRLLPGTRNVVFVHIETSSYLFDVESGSFIEGAEFMPPGVGRQTYPAQTGHVLLPQKEGDPPRILIVGGSAWAAGGNPTDANVPGVKDGFIFEFNPSAPASSKWRKTMGQLHDTRLLADTVLLPDGSVFVVNGIAVGVAAGHSGRTAGTAEIFDPITETFTLAASPSSAHPRGYHATAVLLPDARVAIAGNTATYNPGEVSASDDVSIEIYNPPYLSMGPRPVVSTPLPASIDYGAKLTIDNTALPTIDAVMLMRPCAVTHSVDMDQRAVKLSVGPGANAGTMDIMIPTDRALVPPGPYMLFFLASGVPSVASFIFVGAPAPATSQGGDDGGTTDCSTGGPWPSVNLGTRSGPANSAETYDGDCLIDKLDNSYHLTLQSRHGGITINHKIDQHSTANLTACGQVFIGETIDQHSTANISTHRGVHIVLKIDAGSTVTINADKEIEIGQTIDQWSGVNMTAGTTVHIGLKIDQHSTVTIIADGDVTIDQGIDQHAVVDITSNNGDIIIGQAVDGNADATLRAPNGSVTIGQKVAGGAKVKWHALSFNCPDTSGGSVTAI